MLNTTLKVDLYINPGHRVTRDDNYDVWKTLKLADVTLFVEGAKFILKCCELNMLESIDIQRENWRII